MSLFALVLACAGTKSVESEGAPASASPAPAERTMKVPEVRAAPRAEHAAQATGFALALHRALAQDGANTVSSGPSAMIAASMLGLGARTHTLDELTALFGVPADTDWHVDNERELAAWNATPGVRLATANGLWVDQGTTLDPEYVRAVGTHYGTAPTELPFTQDPGAAARTLDGWTDTHTFGMIPKLFKPDQVAGASLVLANAVAFQGHWKFRFDEASTAPGPFQVGGAPVQVPTMHQQLAARHLQGAGWRGLVLPYEGEAVSMLVLLPDPGVELSAVEADLSHAQLTELTQAPPVTVQVALPRFGFEIEHDLQPVFPALGAPTLLGPGSDLHGMGIPAVVDKAIQKVFIQVDEQGTEAAAVTAITMKRSAGPPPVRFEVDRPFVFAIWHHETGVPLFLGRVADPRG